MLLLCFSESASYGIGSFLIPLGLFCVYQSVLKDKSLFAIACVPLIFGIQQISEGNVWRDLSRHDSATNPFSVSSYFFLFVASSFWPGFFWGVAALKSFLDGSKHRWFWLISLVFVWGFWHATFSIPIFLDWGAQTAIRVVSGSIQYDYFWLPIYQVLPRIVLQFLYLLSIAIPVIFKSEIKIFRTFAVLLIISSFISRFFYLYAYASVWCFFAAIISSYFVWEFYHLESPKSKTQ